MNNGIKKAMPIVLAVTGSVGVIATSVLVAKEAPKASKKLEEVVEEDKKKALLQKGTIVFKSYWPAILCGVGTIASIVASTIISKRTEASLIATATVLSQGWNKYKYKVKELLGPEVNDKITNAISHDEYKQKVPEKEEKKTEPSNTSNKVLYYEEHLGFFECDQVKFMAALNDLNQRLHVPDADVKGTFYWATLKTFADDAKAVLRDKSKLEACKNIGWTADYLAEVYGLTGVWVHPYYWKVYDKTTNKLLYTKIEFWEEPIVLSDTETSRLHYKSRADFEHEAECDMNASRSINEQVLYEKEDCNLVTDDLGHLMLSDPDDVQNSIKEFEEEEKK